MSLYNFATVFLGISVLVGVVGVLFRLPFFLNRRLVALGFLLILGLVGPQAEKLRTFKDIHDDQEIDRAIAVGEARDNVKSNLTIDATVNRYRGTIGGKIINSSPFTYKNVRATCLMRGESGKAIKSVDIEVLKVVKKASTTKFDGLNAGYIDPQAVSFSCAITGADSTS